MIHNSISLNQKVMLPDGRIGSVQYVGEVNFQRGTMVGVLLDYPYEGNSDGCVKGWRYFDAPFNKAVFVKKEDLQVVRPTNPRPRRRLPHSISVSSAQEPSRRRRDPANTENQRDIDSSPFPDTNSDAKLTVPSIGSHTKYSTGEIYDIVDEPSTPREPVPMMPIVRNHSRSVDDVSYQPDSTNLEPSRQSREPDSIEPSRQSREPVGLQAHPVFEDATSDKYQSWARGMAAALRHDLGEYSNGQNDTIARVDYIVAGATYEEILQISEERFAECLSMLMPEHTPRDFLLDFQDTGDGYTRMKIRVFEETSEKADETKWTLLDPVFIRKLNKLLMQDDSTQHVHVKHGCLDEDFLKRKRNHSDRSNFLNGGGTVQKADDSFLYQPRENWIKPCLASTTCWVLLLTLMLPLVFAYLFHLDDDVHHVDQEVKALPTGGYTGLLVDMFSNKTSDTCCNSIESIQTQVTDLGDKYTTLINLENSKTTLPSVQSTSQAESCCSQVDSLETSLRDLLHQIETLRSEVDSLKARENSLSTKVIHESIDTTGQAVAQCPEDWKAVSCWVYMPNHYFMYYTFADLDNTFSSCTCFCRHRDDNFGCSKEGAQCKIKCAKETYS